MYFFDLEDYRTWGFFGYNYELQTVDKLPWHDVYDTFRATRDAHYKAINEYYFSGINVVRIEDREAIFNANRTFHEYTQVLDIKQKQFWQMMLSFRYKNLFDDEIITNGTIISVKNEYQLSEEEKANGHLFLFNNRISDTSPNMYAFIQPEGTPINLIGQMSFYNSIENGDLFTIQYTQFDVNIYNEYKTALQNVMAAEKALIESIDGEQTIIG